MEYKGFEFEVFYDDRPRKGKGPFAARPTPYCCRWRKQGETEWRGTRFNFKTEAAAWSGAQIAIDESIAKEKPAFHGTPWTRTGSFTSSGR